MATIEQNVKAAIENSDAKAGSKEEKHGQEALCQLITQALTDLNRIANALEKLQSLRLG